MEVGIIGGFSVDVLRSTGAVRSDRQKSPVESTVIIQTGVLRTFHLIHSKAE